MKTKYPPSVGINQVATSLSFQGDQESLCLSIMLKISSGFLYSCFTDPALPLTIFCLSYLLFMILGTDHRVSHILFPVLSYSFIILIWERALLSCSGRPRTWDHLVFAALPGFLCSFKVCCCQNHQQDSRKSSSLLGQQNKPPLLPHGIQLASVYKSFLAWTWKISMLFLSHDGRIILCG